jgi:hypothetical protein
MRWLLEPYGDPATYRAIAYLLLGLPLGIVGFVVVVVGLSLGLGLAVTLLGIPVLVATLLLVRSLASFERTIAAGLLDAPMPRLAREDGGDGFWWARLARTVDDGHVRAELAFLVLRFPLGVADFVVVATLLSLALAAVVQPILVAAGVPTEFGTWEVDTFAETLVFVPVSVFFLLTGPRLLLAWAEVPRLMATRLLGRVESADLKREIAEVLAHRDEMDAFEIVDELRLRLGRGPYLTATRVEAALLGLEWTGRVHTLGGDGRTRYRLA